MRVHIDPLFGTIAPCPVCGEAGIHLCPAEDQRRVGWNAAIEEAVMAIWDSISDDFHCRDAENAVRAIKYDLDK